MYQFTIYTEKIGLPANEVRKKIGAMICEQPYLQWKRQSRLKFFKGVLRGNEFNIKSVYYYETLQLKGKIQSDAAGNCVLSIQAQLDWTRYIIYVLLLITVFGIFTFLSVLMLNENIGYGIVGGLLAFILTVGLFFNLIGNHQRKYAVLRFAFLKRIVEGV